MSDAQNGGNMAKPSDNPLVEEILNLEFPSKRIAEMMHEAIRGFAKTSMPAPTRPEIELRRSQLLARAQSELVELRARLRSAEQARAEAAAAKAKQIAHEKAAAAEASRFYNRREANAHFRYWLAMDFWTPDQAIALLLGKDPRQVNWESLQKELDPPRLLMTPKPKPTGLLLHYVTLRSLAAQSDIMGSADKVRPADVVNWAVRRLRIEVPEPLRHLAAPSDASSHAQAPAVDERPSAADSPAAGNPPSQPAVLVKRAALRAQEYRWPTVENDLRHSDRNGLAKAAKAEERGMWREQDALEWARRNGRLKETRPGYALDALPRRVIRRDD